MERDYSFTVGEYYHIYSRGVDKRLIFSDNADRAHFQKLLFLCNSTEHINLRLLPNGLNVYEVDRAGTLVDIGCYTEMPNHIHLLIYELVEGGLTLFMRRLLTAYAMYFNHKVGRTGTLFDGRFRAKHVTEETYFHYLYAYLHLNIIKLIEPKWKDNGIKNLSKAEKFLAEYSFSSYKDFCGIKRLENKILNRASFPEEFRSTADFKTFTHEWLTYSNSEF